MKKKCIICFREFDDTLFVSRKGRKNKTCSKRCFKIWKKEYMKQYWIDNPDKADINRNRATKRWMKLNKDNPDKIKEYRKKYNEENKDKIKEYRKKYNEANKEYRKQYRKENKDKIKERVKQYYKDNPDKIRIIWNRNYETRKDWGDPIILNTYFDDAHLHHLHPDGDRRYCIYIPEELHKSIWHANNNLESMNKINREIVKWINSGKYIKSNINYKSIYDFCK